MNVLTEDQIVHHLCAGGEVEDWEYGEPGLCSNGGHYYRRYWLDDDGETLRESSSYEDAVSEVSSMTVEDLVKLVILTQDQTSVWDGSILRWRLSEC